MMCPLTVSGPLSLVQFGLRAAAEEEQATVEEEQTAAEEQTAVEEEQTAVEEEQTAAEEQTAVEEEQTTLSDIMSIAPKMALRLTLALPAYWTVVYAFARLLKEHAGDNLRL